MPVSKDYIFRQKDKNHLEFIGDFEGLYKNENNTWGQDGKDNRLREYYKFSRNRIVKTLKDLRAPNNMSILEVGCGLGYVLNEINKAVPKNNITGMDISPTAITKAKKLFPDYDYIVGDICSKKLIFKKKFNVMLFNNILWYLLEDLPLVFENIKHNIAKNGYIIFVQAFLKQQNYGVNVIDGFNGFIKNILVNHPQYDLLKAEINYNKFIHHDGIILLKVKDT